jgi:uncharacterized membrane protein YebE (DUF533 family)
MSIDLWFSPHINDANRVNLRGNGQFQDGGKTMSIMKTLAKVAIGVAVAKGASAMMNRQGGGGGGGAAQAGLGGLLGGLAGGGGAGLGQAFGGAHSPGAAGGGPDLQNMLGGLLGGGGAAGGGLGGLLEQIGGAQAGGGGGGLGGLLGGLAGAAGAGGALGGLAGALQGRSAEPETASFGDVLNSAFDQTPQTAIAPSPDQEAAAALMLSAMIQAAKSDGQLDEAEKEKLMGQLGGDIDASEAEFLRQEMAKPVDVAALVRDTPQGMGPQIYMMSLLAIDLDNQNEAQYLHSLAQGYGLDAAMVNDIHERLGVPSLYT